MIFERAESVSQKMTWGFLTRRSKEYEEKGKKWLVVIWDNASWHTGKLWSWVREHNRKALRNGSIRIIPILLPRHSPWLNPLEAIVGRAKRRVLGNRCFRSLQEMGASLEAHFKCRNRCYACKD